MATPLNTQPRVFKIGSKRIVEESVTVLLTNDQMRDILKRTYPEVANATITERTVEGNRVVEFLPQPGRKG